MMSCTLTLLHPLDAFYAQAGLAVPAVHAVPGEEVPEPYRRLLVHGHDMTPTLEAFHRERIHLRVLARRHDGEALWRQVVLTLDGSARPVEFGAIVIYLRHFPLDARKEILDGWRPLGAIMRDHRIEHQSCPRLFLRVTSDALMNEALGLAEPQPLYGRRNVIRDATGSELADVVEILPPAKEETRT
jgi:chorismate-pyruvate lyase